MKKKLLYQSCAFFLIVLSASCKNDKTFFCLKNVSSFKNVYLRVTADKIVIVDDTLQYDNSEYGHVVFDKKLEYGVHQITVVIPELKIVEVKEIKVEKLSKFCFITVGDNLSKQDYKKGDVKVSISITDKLPF